MPPLHPLSLEQLSQDGMFLIENGMMMMLWVGKNCPPQVAFSQDFFYFFCVSCLVFVNRFWMTSLVDVE